MKASLHYSRWYHDIVYVDLGNMRDVIYYVPWLNRVSVETRTLIEMDHVQCGSGGLVQLIEDISYRTR